MGIDADTSGTVKRRVERLATFINARVDLFEDGGTRVNSGLTLEQLKRVISQEIQGVLDDLNLEQKS